MNQVILVGNLVRSPELKESANHNKYLPLVLAVHNNKDKETDFIDMVAFGSTAEFLSTYGEKGRKIVVKGRLSSSNYQDKDGAKRWSLKVVVDTFEFVSRPKNAEDVVAVTISE